MLSPYRVLDATDHRGQIAGMILAGLGAEVLLLEPPGGSPNRKRDILEWRAYNRGKHSVVRSDDDTDDLVASADILLDNGQFDRASIAERFPHVVHVSITAFGVDGPKAAWAASDLTILASACVLALTGDADRPPVRTSVPQAWLHAGSEAVVGALLALTARRATGRGQHVDVSAQQAAMQAAFPASLYGPNGNPEAERMAGGTKVGPIMLQLVYAASDGYVSVSIAFGPMFAPYMQHLMDWAYDEGVCTDEVRSWDWRTFGLRLLTAEGMADFETVKQVVAALTARHTKADLFAEAHRRQLLLAPVRTAGELLADEHLHQRGYWDTVDGVPCPGAFVRSSIWRAPELGAAPPIGSAAAPARPPFVPAPAPRSGPGPTAAPLARAAPLDGLRVVDLTWVFAGPSATRLLADYGATVIKVEAPVRYDPTRTMAAVLEGDAGPEGSATFAHLNSGKLGVTIDLNTEAGRDVVRDLVRWADVVVESFTPGVMERWGLGYESLRVVNPRFVMLSTSLMGQTGPLAEFAGFGNLAGAISGFYELTGWPDRSPAGPYLAYTDYVSPRFLLAALLASLDLRARTGEGQHLDVSQYEASIHFLAPALLEFAVTGVEPTRAGNTDKNAHPHGVFRCAGGSEAWIAVACETDEQRAALASVVGEATEAALAAWAQAHDVPAAEAAFQAVGVPAHGVQNSVGCLADPQLIHRGHFVDVEHAVHPHCIVEGPRAKLSETPGRVVRANPMLGEHNAAVLRELLGYDEDRYVELLVAGVLG